MNELIVVCHKGFTLKKLKIFTESAHLHGRGDLKNIIAHHISLEFHLRTRSLSGKQKALKPQTIRQRLHNAHLAASWDIWLLFNPQKKKNQQGFGLILLAQCFFSPCWLEDECELRHLDSPTEPSPGSPSAYFNCEMDSDGILVTCWLKLLFPLACWVRDPARGLSQDTYWETVSLQTAQSFAAVFQSLLQAFSLWHIF